MNIEQDFSEIELRRFFGDQRARADASASALARARDLQTVVAKLQALSDAEFEVAYKAFSSIVDSYHQQKSKEKGTKEEKPIKVPV